ncbi:hypothetical protein ABFS83_08G171900 [Erythranthe nasuta]
MDIIQEQIFLFNKSYTYIWAETNLNPINSSRLENFTTRNFPRTPKLTSNSSGSYSKAHHKRTTITRCKQYPKAEMSEFKYGNHGITFEWISQDQQNLNLPSSSKYTRNHRAHNKAYYSFDRQ